MAAILLANRSPHPHDLDDAAFARLGQHPPLSQENIDPASIISDYEYTANSGDIRTQ